MFGHLGLENLVLWLAPEGPPFPSLLEAAHGSSRHRSRVPMVASAALTWLVSQITYNLAERGGFVYPAGSVIQLSGYNQGPPATEAFSEFAEAL
jgi:hypothetical protein